MVWIIFLIYHGLGFLIKTMNFLLAAKKHFLDHKFLNLIIELKTMAV